MSDEAGLAALLEFAGIEKRLADRLARYGAMLLAANRRINLSGAASPEQLLPHLLDSLSIVPYVTGPLVDVGSGGGLPGIPAAIASGMHVTLLEATGKKAAFLQATLRELGLQGEVIAQRAESAARADGLRGRFTSATARAVSSAPAVLEMTIPFLKIGGIAVLQRGRMESREREAATDAAPMLGAQLEREVALEGGRRILLFSKIRPTPDRFPRRTGIPEKRPLCL